MKISKNPTIAAINDILSHIQRKKMEAVKDGDTDAVDVYAGMFRFVSDMYFDQVAGWKRKHPISTLIMNIRHKRRLNRLREMTAEIRGTWV